MARTLKEWPGCFVCGMDNKCGLQVKLEYEDGEVRAGCKPGKHHAGYTGVIHGGIISALLDEVMVWAPMAVNDKLYFTGEMTVRFIKPLPDEVEVIAIGRLVKNGSKLCLAEGELKDAEGNVYATSTGKYFPVPADHPLSGDR